MWFIGEIVVGARCACYGKEKSDYTLRAPILRSFAAVGRWAFFVNYVRDSVRRTLWNVRVCVCVCVCVCLYAGSRGTVQYNF